MGERRPVVWWLAAAGILASVYWLSLRFFFPGYFHPFWPSHDDFYLYASMGNLTWEQVSKFPRPVAYGVMKVLGTFGLTGVMAGCAGIALVNLLLIAGLALRLFEVRITRWALLPLAVFSLLVCTHAQFYFDHRHDLPAQTSLLFLLLAFYAWLAWVRRCHAAWMAIAVACTLLFAFAKETYFASAAIAWLALVIADRQHRKAHAGFLGFILVAEIASLGWSRHINGPFVDPGAAAESAYRMSLAPRDVLLTYDYYLRHALNPALILWIVLCLACAWWNRRRLFAASAFIAAGLGVFLPHAVLPNHKFAEYAWAAVPFLVAVTFLLPGIANLAAVRRSLTVVATVALLAWTLFEYHRSYQSAVLVWGIEQERLGGALVKSFPKLDAIPQPAQIAVAGIETPFIPWSSPHYIRGRFGDQRRWTVIVKPDRSNAPSDPLCRLATGRFVRLADYDALVTYDPGAHLVSIRYRRDLDIAGRQAQTELLVPAVAAAERRAEANPQAYDGWMAAASMALEWGLWEEALRLLDRAQPLAPPSAPLWHLYAARAQIGLGQPDEAEQQLAGLESSNQVSELRRRIESLRARVPPTLVAIPPFIAEPDANGLGAVELKWSAAQGTRTEIHVNAPDGPMLTSGGAVGQARTEHWVKDGMEFFLQDVTEGKPLAPEFTLARIRVSVAKR